MVIPAFEPGPRLRRALGTVLRQTVSDWDAVVIDDGSSEDLRWVATVDPRIRYVRQDNAGVSIARNRAVMMTDASLVAFLDQDDEWIADKLERQLSVLEQRPDIALCDTRFAIVAADGSRISCGYSSYGPGYHGLLSGGAIGMSTVVVRRDALLAVGGFNRLYRVMQDHDVYLRLAEAGFELHRIDEELALYTLHGQNVSADYWLGFREFEALLLPHRVRARADNDEAALIAIAAGRAKMRAALASQAIDCSRRRFRGRHLGAAASDFARAGRIAPGVALRSVAGALRRRAQPRRGPHE